METDSLRFAYRAKSERIALLIFVNDIQNECSAEKREREGRKKRKDKRGKKTGLGLKDKTRKCSGN